MSAKTIRVGLVGAGYIASWHGDAVRTVKGTEITAVCDVSSGAAEGLAAKYGAAAFTSIDDLIAANVCDAVHILTPPQLHKNLAITCLQAGLHCLVEKPFALSHQEALAICEAAKSADRRVAVGHNFLGLPSYQRMKAARQNGQLGRISSAELNWNFPLAPLRSGPFGLWMLREPKNLLLELSPHLFAFADDLFGAPEILHLELAKPIELSGGGSRNQSFRILARAGDVDLTFNLQLAETMDDRSVTLNGSTGIARLNFAADTLITSRENAADIVINPFLYQMSHAGQHLREGVRNVLRHIASLNRKSAYGLSFANTMQSFYASVQNNAPVDATFSANAAARVAKAMDDTIALMPNAGLDPAPAKPKRRKPKPTVLVIGGTGFVGRHLTRALVASGRDVRVLTRGNSAPFGDIADRVETFSASLADAAGLRNAMQGIDAVYHLAKSVDTTWEDCLKNDVGVTERIAHAALQAGVKRFVYTGTIASYDMSDPNRTITEQTGFDADMSDRNLYARSKAACETRLSELHKSQNLPLVIARPGIVLGAGGPLQHWGIGRWQGAGTVRIWGSGKNILPFVLIDDVCDGLIQMLDVDDAVGQSFNLVGEPMMTARDYFDAVHRILGAKIQVRSGNLYSLFAADAVKSVLKKFALRRQSVIRPSLRDWKSRAHFSRFEINHPKQMLKWAPEANTDVFLEKAITHAGLFGF
ncbi:MAG: NAD-dependent epimerase/dehydratase family protein [Rhodobacteraceae bacterium]|nr:NAD-dependent epimerase/dehydratase family protein [Paracoccaceae bacterium]